MYVILSKSKAAKSPPFQLISPMAYATEKEANEVASRQAETYTGSMFFVASVCTKFSGQVTVEATSVQ